MSTAVQRLLAAVAFLAGAAALRASPELALGPEETLVYKVAWAVLPGVGEIRVSAHPTTDPKGTPLLQVVTTTRTSGLARLILPFDAEAESLFDASNGRLLWLGETSRTRSKLQKFTVAFDYLRRTATYKDDGKPPRPLSVPPGHPNDLITSLLFARTWNLAPGQKRDMLVLFKDDFYLLTVHALGYEDVDTSLGTFRALVLEPRMEETPPKGMFRKGSTVKVWISQDPRRLPVQFQVRFSFGSGIATLDEYLPPAPR